METIEFCVRIFNAIGTNRTIRDIDIVHRVTPRDATGGRPKPIICIYVYQKLSPEFAFKGHLTKTYGHFCNFNRENVRRDISRQDWSCISDDPNVLWADWKAKFLTIVNSHVPIKTKRVRSSKVPWIISHLRKGMRDHDVAKWKTIKSNDPQHWAAYKRLRNNINREVEFTKASYYWSFTRTSGAVYLSKSTLPRKFGNQVTEHRPLARPSVRTAGKPMFNLTLSS